MKNLKTFEDYSHITESAKKGLLFEVWLELSKVSKLSDVRFGKAISDYLHFVIDDKLFFDISMTDNNKTISIIVFQALYDKFVVGDMKFPAALLITTSGKLLPKLSI